MDVQKAGRELGQAEAQVGEQSPGRGDNGDRRRQRAAALLLRLAQECGEPVLKNGEIVMPFDDRHERRRSRGALRS